MEFIFVVFLIALTSAAGYGIITRRRPGRAQLILPAICELLDCAGLFTLFMAANMALGLLFVFLIRGLTPRFVSVYRLESILLLALSAAQAFVFQRWWKRD